MAKLVTQTHVITVSRMTRDSDTATQVVAEDFAETLVAELALGALVEVVGVDHD